MCTAHKEAVSGCDAQMRCPQKGGKAEQGQIDRLPSTGKTSQMDSFPAKYGCRFFGQNRFHLNKGFASLFDLIQIPLRVLKSFCKFLDALASLDFKLSLSQ